MGQNGKICLFFNQYNKLGINQLKPITDIISVEFNSEESAKEFASACKQYGADSQGKNREMYGKHPTKPKKYMAFISLSKDVPILLQKTKQETLSQCLSNFLGEQVSNPAWELNFKDQESAILFTKLYKKFLGSITVPGKLKKILTEKTGIFSTVYKILLTPKNLMMLNEFKPTDKSFIPNKQGGFNKID